MSSDFRQHNNLEVKAIWGNVSPDKQDYSFQFTIKNENGELSQQFLTRKQARDLAIWLLDYTGELKE